VGCGSGSEVGKAPERQLIDEEQGTYRGVGLGDGNREVLEELGPTEVTRDGQTGGVQLVNGGDHGAANLKINSINGKPPRQEFIGYREANFLLFAPRHVNRWVVHDVRVGRDGAATSRGVAIGDTLQEAEAAYPEIDCATANEGTEYATYPFCAGELATGRNIWFGGDPIDIIELNTGKYPNAPATIEEKRQRSN
jgi:hypothetical protein